MIDPCVPCNLVKQHLRIVQQLGCPFAIRYGREPTKPVDKSRQTILQSVNCVIHRGSRKLHAMQTVFMTEIYRAHTCRASSRDVRRQCASIKKPYILPSSITSASLAHPSALVVIPMESLLSGVPKPHPAARSSLPEPPCVGEIAPEKLTKLHPCYTINFPHERISDVEPSNRNWKRQPETASDDGGKGTSMCCAMDGTD